MMLNVIELCGLPTDAVVVAIRERQVLLSNMPFALEGLDETQRARAAYIARMMLAASVGLFDAALNYLWNETINELRTRIASFDVAYFFEIAEQDPARRKDLRTPDDLEKIDDQKLMQAANRIQLISDVGFRQLDHIRYMRNNASAAHPNQVTLTGLKLAEWLETCIREVITLPHTNVVADIGRLLHNVKAQRLPADELDKAAAFFDGLPDAQADNLAAGLFGIYTPPDATPDVLDNVRQLWPKLWPNASETARNECGVKLARFRANADNDRAERARELLDLVDGAAYLPETERTAELAKALRELHDTHEAMNNFYNEPAVANRLAELVGRYGSVPTQLVESYVNVIVYVFLTNGHGEAHFADPIYKDLIGLFDTEQASLALRTFAHDLISSRLQFDLPRKKWIELLDLIVPKLTGRRDRALLESVLRFTGTPDQLVKDSDIRRQLAQWSTRNIQGARAK
ncbi:hypothetical protein [Lentzea pudingi]|uniref:hypothetical protein n=1 Tax=Lentzea pudingi TaxID=1789439 RepID=UPI001E4606CC|nr:hypothetical protein [Lentzea pudingi]